MDFVAAMEKCSIREAACRLQRWFGEAAPPAHAAQGSVPKRELVREKEGCNPPLRFVLTGVDHGHGYLEQRSIDRATAVEFGVGFYGGPGLMSGRIVIPIRNSRGEIVAYAGRTLNGELPKYKLPAGFRKGWELFNIQRAAATSSQRVIVVEGYFDCVRVHQAGFPFVVALMGSSLSVEQESALLQRFDRMVLLLDGDAAGIKCTEKALKISNLYTDKSSLYKTHKDLNEWLLKSSLVQRKSLKDQKALLKGLLLRRIVSILNDMTTKIHKEVQRQLRCSCTWLDVRL